MSCSCAVVEGCAPATPCGPQVNAVKSQAVEGDKALIMADLIQVRLAGWWHSVSITVPPSDASTVARFLAWPALQNGDRHAKPTLTALTLHRPCILLCRPQ